jgi:hypothetical protein
MPARVMVYVPPAQACAHFERRLRRPTLWRGNDTINIGAGTYIVSRRIRIEDSVDLLGAGASSTFITGRGPVGGGPVSPIFLVTRRGTAPGPTVNIHRLTLHNGWVETLSGAALFNDEGATTRVWDSIVRDNYSSTWGGAISNFGKLQIIRSEIRNNRLPDGGGGATSSGGGIYNEGELEIACSAVTENFAVRGGGIFNLNGVVKIKNSTISSNRALGGGGGIRNVGNGRLFVASSTITLNRGNEPSASVGAEPNRTGGGIQTISPATVWIGGSILAGNTDNRSRFQTNFSPDCYSDSSDAFKTMRSNLFGVVNKLCQLSDGGSNPSVDLKGTDTMPLDPKLEPLDAMVTRIHALQVGSSAIDHNTTTATFFACESVDQRGSARPIDGDGDGQASCDIGAYERRVPPSAVNTAACETLHFELPSMPPGNLEVR